MIDEYSKLLLESGIFFPGSSKGSLILPPNGLTLWQNIQNILDKKFAQYGIQNVLLPTLIPLILLEKEKKHIKGFNPECFYIERIGAEKLENSLILRPTSEVLFYDWYRQTLQSYQQLPFLYNQWCQVFRAEKNTKPFFRNTEFLWQEGHTLHENAEEAQKFSQKIWQEYQDYAEKNLCLAIIAGKKSEKEKFAGALESYTVECLLPDGQCLQLATSHYFGDNFCQAMDINFRNKQNQLIYPFSTSWGTSFRAIGAIVKVHVDSWGLILPFDIAPVQIAFVLIEKSEELIEYYKEISDLLIPYFRCRLYNKNSQVNSNILQADKEGCPFKIIIGKEELKKGKITLIRRDNIEQKIPVDMLIREDSEFEKKYLPILENFADKISEINDRNKKETFTKGKETMRESMKKGARLGNIFGIIEKEKEELQKNTYQKNADFRDNHIYQVVNFFELEKKINEEKMKGLFLIPFCNNPNCEESISKRLPSYSIRCISIDKKTTEQEKCIFCLSHDTSYAYLGRSY